MTDFKVYKPEPLDYCIEISKMLKTQDKDKGKLIKLFVDVFTLPKGAEFVNEYANNSDQMMGAFCQAAMMLAQERKITVARSIGLCHEIHVNMELKDLRVEDTDSEAEVQRKTDVAQRIFERVVDGREDDFEEKGKRGFWERVAGFLRRD